MRGPVPRLQATFRKVSRSAGTAVAGPAAETASEPDEPSWNYWETERACERQGEGRIVLTRVAVQEPAEAFPRGSLRKYFIRAKAKEELSLLKGCSLEVPE
jgi:hypothetical protein